MNGMSWVLAVLANFPLMAALTAMGVAQTLKIFYYYFKDGEWIVQHLFETGGMPSGHSATVTALTVGIGMTHGITTPVFAAAAVFSIIIMYDAAGVRRATGKQALILNRIVEDIYATGKIREEKLRELVGHSPFEIFVGVLLGLATVSTLHMWWR